MRELCLEFERENRSFVEIFQQKICNDSAKMISTMINLGLVHKEIGSFDLCEQIEEI